jgi:hypothetical protein
VSNVTIAAEDEPYLPFASEPKSISFPSSTEPVRVPRPLSTNNPFRTPSTSTQNTLVEDTVQSSTPRVRDDLPPRHSRSNTASINTTCSPNHSNTTSQANPLFQHQLLQEAAANESDSVWDSENTSDSTPSSSSHSSSHTSGRIRITNSTRAEYERLMKVFFKAPASRRPIPTAWRKTPPGVHGPSSSTCRRESRASSTTVSSRNSNSRLQAIASRPLQQLPCPGHVVSSRSGTRRGHTIPGSRRRSTVTRARRNRTLPHGWTARGPVTPAVAPTDTNICVAEDVDGSDDMSCLESLGVEGEDVNGVCSGLCKGEGDISVQGAGGSCAASLVGLGKITDDLESVVSGEDVWFDVSDVAVVDEPLR